MRRVMLLVLGIIISVSLAGCSQDQSKKIDELNLKNNELNTKMLELYGELAMLKEQDFANKYEDGEFDCHNPYGIQKVKFLSSRVMFIYGVTEYNDLAYNNYYVINLVGKNKYEIVDEVKLPDSLPKRTIEFLRWQWTIGIKYMKEIEILDDGNTLTIQNEPTEVCTFVKNK